MNVRSKVLACFRRLRWWQRSLIAIGVLLGGVALLLALIVAYFVYAFDRDFDSDEYGFHDIDETAAADALERRAIRIPDGFTFGSMTEYAVFVGYDSYSGRYSAPGDLAGAEHLLEAANPSLPRFQPVSCDHEIVVHDFADMDQFRCTGAQVALSTRTDPLTDHYAGTPTDTESLLLVDNDGRVTLFVVARGH